MPKETIIEIDSLSTITRYPESDIRQALRNFTEAFSEKSEQEILTLFKNYPEIIRDFRR